VWQTADGLASLGSINSSSSESLASAFPLVESFRWRTGTSKLTWRLCFARGLFWRKADWVLISSESMVLLRKSLLTRARLSELSSGCVSRAVFLSSSDCSRGRKGVRAFPTTGVFDDGWEEKLDEDRGRHISTNTLASFLTT